MTTLDVDSCSNLTTLECYSNSLSSLNVSLCVNLTRLDCNSNPLTSLNVSNCPLLEHLYCYNCDLSSLTLNNPLLYVLLAYGNNLTELNIENSPDLVNASNTEAQTNADFGENTLIYIDNLSSIESRVFYYYCLAVDNTVTLVPAPDDTHIVELTPANFEDGKFLEFVKKNYDKDGDNWLSQSEISAVMIMRLNHDDPVTNETVGENITSLMIYQAINESDEVHVFDLHQNPSDECIVGRHIRPVLNETFREIEEKAERQLRQTTLADCMEKMRKEIDKRKTV